MIFLDKLTAGRGWRITSLFVALFLGIFLSYTPWLIELPLERGEEELESVVRTFEAYLAKIDAPLLDMVKEGHSMESHASKLTPRILIPALLNVCGIDTKFELAIYAIICSVILLLCVQEFVFRNTQDRVVALLATSIVGVSLTLVHTATGTGWLFDPAALALAGVLLLVQKRPVVFAVVATVSLFADERMVLAMATIVAFSYVQSRSIPRTVPLVLGSTVAVAIMFVGRKLISNALDWQLSLGGTGMDVLGDTAVYAPLIAIGALEGMVLVFVFLLGFLLKEKAWLSVVALLGFYGFSGLMSCFVLDLTRTASFFFPATAGMAIVCHKYFSSQLSRQLLLAGLVIGILIPSYTAIGPPSKILFMHYPTPVAVLKSLL